MAWEEAAQLRQRFTRVCEYLQILYPRWPLGTSYSGWSQALQACTPTLLPAVCQRLRREVQRVAQPCWRHRGWALFAADGSRLECPRTAANEAGLGCAGKERTAPQLMLTTLYHLDSGLPWAFHVGPGTESERRQLDALLPTLPADTLLLCDAGFVSYELGARLLAAGHHFLLRVGRNVTLLTELGWETEIAGETVFLWPEKCRRHGQPPLRLRLIVVPDAEQTVCLLTDLSPSELPNAEAGPLYRRRWGVEVFYRSYKRTMDHHRLHSRTPATCLTELPWTMVGFWLLALMTTAALLATGQCPGTASTAASRNTVRQTLRGVLSGKPAREPLGASLARAVKDGYPRSSRKKARNWPHKKRERPPGPPQVRSARPIEIQRAQQLTPQPRAA